MSGGCNNHYKTFNKQAKAKTKTPATARQKPTDSDTDTKATQRQASTAMPASTSTSTLATATADDDASANASAFADAVHRRMYNGVTSRTSGNRGSMVLVMRCAAWAGQALSAQFAKYEVCF